MRWDDERYVRVYIRDTADWLGLSFDAQALFCLLLRKVDRAGIMQLGKHGKRSVAICIGHPHEWTRIEPALEELLQDGCVRADGNTLVIPNFIEAQESKQSDRLRQAEYRARARERSASRIVTTCREGSQEATKPSNPLQEQNRANDTSKCNVDDSLSRTVTSDHAMSPNVATTSHAVTPSLAVLSLAVPLETCADAPQPQQTEIPGTSATKKPGGGRNGGKPKLPFSIREALVVLGACPRVVIPDLNGENSGKRIGQLSRVIQLCRSPEALAVMAEWINAGGGFPQQLDLDVLTSKADTWLAAAKAWAGNGHHPVTGQRKGNNTGDDLQTFDEGDKPGA